MTILLQVWDLMITDTLNPSKAHLNSFSEVDIQNLIVQSEAERENVRKLLIENIIEKSKNFNREQYVQVHQAMLIRLLDKLYSYINDSRLNKKLLRLYNSIKEHLENTLDFIEDFFNNYFDRNEKVPVTYLTISLEDLCKQLQKLKEINQDVNPELMDVLANNFRNFFKKKNAGITYNQMMYQKDLMNELLAEAPNSESAIKKVLFYFNFNDEDFIAYIYRQLTSLIEPQL